MSTQSENIGPIAPVSAVKMANAQKKKSKPTLTKTEKLYRKVAFRIWGRDWIDGVNTIRSVVAELRKARKEAL